MASEIKIDKSLTNDYFATNKLLVKESQVDNKLTNDYFAPMLMELVAKQDNKKFKNIKKHIKELRKTTRQLKNCQKPLPESVIWFVTFIAKGDNAQGKTHPVLVELSKGKNKKELKAIKKFTDKFQAEYFKNLDKLAEKYNTDISGLNDLSKENVNVAKELANTTDNIIKKHTEAEEKKGISKFFAALIQMIKGFCGTELNQDMRDDRGDVKQTQWVGKELKKEYQDVLNKINKIQKAQENNMIDSGTRDYNQGRKLELCNDSLVMIDPKNLSSEEEITDNKLNIKKRVSEENNIKAYVHNIDERILQNHEDTRKVYVMFEKELKSKGLKKCSVITETKDIAKESVYGCGEPKHRQFSLKR